MAEYYNNQQEEGVEKVDGALFDQFAKKEEKDDLISSEFEDKVMVSDQLQETNQHTSFTSSKDEEEEYFENEEDKQSKKKLPAAMGGDGEYYEQDKAAMDTQVPEEEYFEDGEQKSRLPAAGIGGEGEYDEQEKPDMDTRVPVENIRDEEEGDLEKKLPGGDEYVVGDEVECPPPTPAAEVAVEEADQPDKKGLFDKIKDKIPGF